MVVSDLLLTPDATPSSLAVTGELARALDTWDGPGILIIAGNLFDLTGVDDPIATAGRAIDAHPALARALIRFLGVDDRRVLRQRGTHEPDDLAERAARAARRGLGRGGHAGRGRGRAPGPGRPPRPDRLRGPRGAGGPRRVRLRRRAGRPRVRPDGRPLGRHQARRRGRLAGGAPLADAGQPLTGRLPVARGRRPPERPVGLHPVPRLRARSTAGSAATPGGSSSRSPSPCSCGWRSPRGCSDTSARASRPGRCATPTRPTSTTS